MKGAGESGTYLVDFAISSTGLSLGSYNTFCKLFSFFSSNSVIRVKRRKQIFLHLLIDFNFKALMLQKKQQESAGKITMFIFSVKY